MSPSQSNLSDHQSKKLSGRERWFFDNRKALSGIIVFPAEGMLGVKASDATLKAAFNLVVKNVPILQTEVAGDEDNAIFQKISDEDIDEKVYCLEIETQIEQNETFMMERARSIMSEILTTLREGGQDSYRLSIRVHAVRCPHAIAFTFVVPQQFSDGTGVASIFAQLYATQLLPSFAWPLMYTRPSSTKGMKLPPSFYETAFKTEDAFEICKNLLNINQLEENPKKTEEKQLLRFIEYDFSSPDAISKLRGMEETLAVASSKSLEKTLSELRKDGISLTSAFDALTTKVVSRLIAEDSYSDSTSSDASLRATSKLGDLTVLSLIDARQFGNISKDSKIEMPLSKAFAEVGNYIFTHNTQISFKDALAQPLQAIAKRIKEGFTRLQTDETYRACHVAASMSTTKGAKLSLYCGTSSLLVSPRFLQRMGVNITSEIKHDFGAMPRCWFYAISHGSKTVIAADIFLPLPNLTAEMTRRVVLEECKGTPLEYLFHQPNVSQ